MSVLLVTHERLLDHRPGSHHPERPDRLPATLAGVDDAALGDDLVRVAAAPAPRELLVALHGEDHVAMLERIASEGGGQLDPDTAMSDASWEAANLAAGAGVQAIELLDRDDGLTAAFCAVRPPGHHATPTRAMGFCLVNNAAVAAMMLADRGERVLVVDYDAHHGNGTQDAFWNDPRVLYVSFHQHPMYPGSGALGETGGPDAPDGIVNLPFPAGTTGDVYREAWERVVLPRVEAFAPSWVVLSAGFDAHRRDPITDLGLSAGDYAQLTDLVVSTCPPGRRLVFLEGGYDLEALRSSSHAMMRALAGEVALVEDPTSGGPGRHVVEAAVPPND